MKRHQVAMSIGATWVLVRFAFVLTIVRDTLDGGMVTNINLLWVGATTIVIAVIFATAAYKADLHVVLVPLLRISTILMVTSDVMVILSGSYAARSTAATADSRTSPNFAVSFVILVVDLLIAAALISYRPVKPHAQDSEDHLPPYRTTDLEGE